MMCSQKVLFMKFLQTCYWTLSNVWTMPYTHAGMTWIDTLKFNKCVDVNNEKTRCSHIYCIKLRKQTAIFVNMLAHPRQNFYSWSQDVRFISNVLLGEILSSHIWRTFKDHYVQNMNLRQPKDWITLKLFKSFIVT